MRNFPFRRRAVSIAFLQLLAVAVATLFSWHLGSSPPQEQVRADLFQVLDESLHGAGEVTATSIEVGDGWSDGAEIVVKFDITPTNDVTVGASPLQGLVMRAGKKIEGGRFAMSYSKLADGTWKLISASLASQPNSN